MPTRPRSHQLEDISRSAFRQAFPSAWVIRDIPQDYGLDLQIEVFDEGGQAARQIFFAQIKATDSPHKKTVDRIWLSREKYEYYCTLNVPVLLVRYSAATDTIYVRWTHSFDFENCRPTKRGVSLQFSEVDSLSPERIGRIPNELDAWSTLNQTTGLPHIRFHLAVTSSSIHGHPDFLVISHVREALRTVDNHISIEEVSDSVAPALNTIEITNERVCVRLAGSIRSSFSTPESVKQWRSNPEYIAQYALISIALALESIGLAALSAILIPSAMRHPGINGRAEIAFTAARILHKGGRPMESMELARQFVGSIDDINSLQALTFPLLASNARCTHTERDFGIRMLRFLAREIHNHDVPAVAGAMHYNAANLARGNNDFRTAFVEYNLARKLEPGYLTRPYFYVEVGGVLYLLRRFRSSATIYNKATELGDYDYRCFEADALLMSGEFANSCQLFSSFQRTHNRMLEPEWFIKHRAAERLRDTAGPHQEPDSSIDLSVFDHAQMNDQELESLCIRIIRRNALCALAHFNLGTVYSRAKDYAAAFSEFAIAGSIELGDVEAWSCAFLCAINLQDNDLLIASGAGGLIVNGEPFRRQASLRLRESNLPTETISRMLETLQSFANLSESNPRRDGAATYRLHGHEFFFDQLK